MKHNIVSDTNLHFIQQSVVTNSLNMYFEMLLFVVVMAKPSESKVANLSAA